METDYPFVCYPFGRPFRKHESRSPQRGCAVWDSPVASHQGLCRVRDALHAPEILWMDRKIVRSVA